jgi:hypothetical protein
VNHHPDRNQTRPNYSHRKALELVLVWVKEKAKEMVQVRCISAAQVP